MKSFFLDIEEPGKTIASKLYELLNKKQREDLIRFFLKKEENFLPLTERIAGDLYFCLEYRVVYVKEKYIKLTVKEFELLALLIMHPKRVFTYEMLFDLIGHEDYTFYSRKAVNNHVSNLRKKLKISPDVPDYIKIVYGVG